LLLTDFQFINEMGFNASPSPTGNNDIYRTKKVIALYDKRLYDI